MKPIRLHWSSSKPNFGDWLSPLICEMVSGREIVLAKPNRCELIALGSILHRAKNRWLQEPVHVWGSGYIEERPVFKSRHYYHAVRGKHTASQIASNNPITTFGDPGLLASELISKTPEKKYEVGLIPHYVDKSNSLITELASSIDNATIIDVFAPPLEVIKQIAQCRRILSSSLHGLIVSDSLGIPNHWIELSSQVKGKGWKFSDYYSAFGLDAPQPLTLIPTLTLEGIEQQLQGYHRPGIDQVKQQLTEAFPLKAGVAR